MRDDESVRAWLADHRSIATEDGYVSTGTPVATTVACPNCSRQLAVRYTFEIGYGERIIAAVEWHEESPHCWTRSWGRVDAGLPARHAGYQKRARHEPVALPSGGTLLDAWYSSDYPGIRELRPEDVLVCRCGERVPLRTAPDVA